MHLSQYDYLVQWPFMIGVCVAYLLMVVVGRLVMGSKSTPVTIPKIIPIVYNVIQARITYLGVDDRRHGGFNVLHDWMCSGVHDGVYESTLFLTGEASTGFVLLS